MFSTAISEIVARHGRDDDVLQAHPTRGFRDALRLIGFESKRFRRAHGAKSASARASVARDHESRGAFAPTLPVVRTLRALANGVQPQAVQKVTCVRKRVFSRQLQAQ